MLLVRYFFEYIYAIISKTVTTPKGEICISIIYPPTNGQKILAKLTKAAILPLINQTS